MKKTSDRATADAYDLDLASSGAGWVGTFSILVRTLVADITDDGPYGPVQVTLSHGEDVTVSCHQGRVMMSSESAAASSRSNT